MNKKITLMFVVLPLIGLALIVGGRYYGTAVRVPSDLRDAVGEEAVSVFYGNGYSVYKPESEVKVREELARYTGALKKAGIKVIKAEKAEVESVFQAKVAYEGKEVLFRETGGTMTLMGAKRKMASRIAELEKKGCLVIFSKAFSGQDEWGKAAGYSIEYLEL